MPVVFDPRVGAGMLGHLIGAITGSAIARKTSFLLDARGKQVFGKGIVVRDDPHRRRGLRRSEEHTSELQSLMRISYAVFCLKKKIHTLNENTLSTTTNTNKR